MEQLQRSVGALPNLAAAMSESPVLISAFVRLRELIRAEGRFDAPTGELLSLANAVGNGCRYCTAIHATFGLAAGVPAATVAALRAGELPAEPRQRALVTFARHVLERRGDVADGELAAFFAAGFDKAHALEVVARLALSVMANYAGRLIRPEPDDAVVSQYSAAP